MLSKFSLSLYDSCDRKRKIYKDQHIKIYSCGPTLYRESHIGNLRTIVLSSLIVSLCEQLANCTVDWLMNVTDIGHIENEGDEDKITAESNARQINFHLLVSQHYQTFIKDLMLLRIRIPNCILPATSTISDQYKSCRQFLEQNRAYENDKGIYSRTDDIVKHFKPKLLSEEYTDFALWRSGNTKITSYNDQIVSGLPGWHIECLSLIYTYFGKSTSDTVIDIHTGGIDLKNIHHNNEIIQNAVLSSIPLASCWTHINHLHFNNEKISKSTTAILLQDLTSTYRPIIILLFLLSKHYRLILELSESRMHEIKNAYRRLMIRTLEYIYSNDRYSLSSFYSLVAVRFADAQLVPLSFLDDLGTTDLHNFLNTDFSSTESINIFYSFNILYRNLFIDDLWGCLSQASTYEYIARTARLYREQGRYDLADKYRAILQENKIEIIKIANQEICFRID